MWVTYLPHENSSSSWWGRFLSPTLHLSSSNERDISGREASYSWNCWKWMTLLIISPEICTMVFWMTTVYYFLASSRLVLLNGFYKLNIHHAAANLHFTLPTERNWFGLVNLSLRKDPNIGTYQVGGFVVSAHPMILLRGIFMGRGVDEMGQPKAPNINGPYFYANGMKIGLFSVQ